MRATSGFFILHSAFNISVSRNRSRRDGAKRSPKETARMYRVACAGSPSSPIRLCRGTSLVPYIPSCGKQIEGFAHPFKPLTPVELSRDEIGRIKLNSAKTHISQQQRTSAEPRNLHSCKSSTQ